MKRPHIARGMALAAAVAVGLGMAILEKHLTLDKQILQEVVKKKL